MNYGTPQAGSFGPPNQGLNITSLGPGDNYLLFNDESPAAPQASVAVAFASAGPVANSGAAFHATWAGAPGGGGAQVDIQASNTDLDADYVSVGSITTFPGYYGDQGNFSFYRAKLVGNSGAGTGLTVSVQRG